MTAVCNRLNNDAFEADSVVIHLLNPLGARGPRSQVSERSPRLVRFRVILCLVAISHHMQVRHLQSGPRARGHATHSPDGHIEAQAESTDAHSNAHTVHALTHTHRAESIVLYSPVSEFTILFWLWTQSAWILLAELGGEGILAEE